jgi:hypothetical protein
MQGRVVTSQNITASTTSQATAPFGLGTRTVRVCSTADVWVSQGTGGTPTAAVGGAGSVLLTTVGGGVEFEVYPGDKMAVVAATGTPVVNFAEIES